MAQPSSSPSPSILAAVGQSILDAASSIDANIDASALVERLSAADGDPTGRRTQKALVELKDLVRRAPSAVTATQGAVAAILRVVTKLAQSCGQDVEADGAERLQDALEALGLLLGAGPPQRSGSNRSASELKEDEAAALRSREVAELAIRHTENGKQLLRILSARDVSTQYDAMVVLQNVYLRMPAPINTALLADPMALNRLMQVLQSCQVDYVRNESLSLLLLLTAANPDIQQIVTMQGLADTIFAMLAEEDLGRGGKVARDLLQCLTNLSSNASCQRCIRETGGIASLVTAMDTALAGQRPCRGPGEEEEEGDLGSSAVEVPPSARWACFLMLSDVALTFADAAGNGSVSVGAATVEAQPEVPANRESLIRHGALDLLRHLPNLGVSLDAKLRLVSLFSCLEASPLAASRLERPVQGASGASLLSLLSSLLLQPAAVPAGGQQGPQLECSLARTLCRAVRRHAPLQLALLASLSPQLEAAPGETPPGRSIVRLLESAAEGRPDAQRLWFAAHLLLSMLCDNASVQSALPSMRIAFPGSDGPAEFGLDLLFMAFSGCARRCVNLGPGDISAGESAPPQDAKLPPAALIAMLKFFAYWLAVCPAALVSFASSPVMVPCAMELTSVDEELGSFFQVQIEGLACVVMGLCIKAEQGSVDAAALMALLAGRVGIEGFQQRLERLFRGEALQRPPRSLAAFRWYSNRFRVFLREQQQAIQRRMVQLYVAEGIRGGSAALSEDVADQYKQLIRVQDEKFREIQKENESLRGEVGAFMRRTLQASSLALVEKVSALRLENDALQREMAQLEEENSQTVARLEHQLHHCRAYVCELEQQHHSMAVGYEQIERDAEAFRLEADRLRSALAASERVRGASLVADASESNQRLALANEVEEARRFVAALQHDKADLLELLGCLVAAFPDAACFVAPLACPARVDMRTDMAAGTAGHSIQMDQPMGHPTLSHFHSTSKFRVREDHRCPTTPQAGDVPVP